MLARMVSYNLYFAGDSRSCEGEKEQCSAPSFHLPGSKASVVNGRQISKVRERTNFVNEFADGTSCYKTFRGWSFMPIALRGLPRLSALRDQATQRNASHSEDPFRPFATCDLHHLAYYLEKLTQPFYCSISRCQSLRLSRV